MEELKLSKWCGVFSTVRFLLLRNRFIWAAKFIPDHLLSFIYLLLLMFLLWNVTKWHRSFVLQVYSSSYLQTFPFILLLGSETELFFFLLAVLCAIQCYIWATVCFIETSRTFVIISSPLTPSFPLSCHSSLLFLSLLLLLQLSDDNAQLEQQLLHNNCSTT